MQVFGKRIQPRWLFLILAIVATIFLLWGCGGGGGGSSSSSSEANESSSTDNGSNDSTTHEDNDTSTIATTESSMDTGNPNSEETENSGEVAACGNEVGNGLEIINGPTTTTDEDHDSVFRSLAVHPTDANTVMIGTERNGFVKSTDGGNTWERFRTGLRHEGAGYPEIWDIAYDPNNPNILYAATLDSPGPVTGSYPSSIGGIYKSIDGGATWTRSNCGLSNSRITSVQVDASDSNIVVIGVEGGTASFTELQGQYFNGGIYRSTDAGTNWSKLSFNDDNDMQNGYWHMRGYGNAGNQFITFGMWSFQNSSTNADGNVGFVRSTDSGATWETFGSPLKTLTITYFDVSADGQMIYANEQNSFVMQISTDGGATWTTTEINQANGSVVVSPNDSQLVLYASTKNLYRSTDGLQTTQQVLAAAQSINDIVFVPSDPTIAYVATEGYLIYKSVDTGATFSLVKDIRNDVLNQ